ncbi:hypothetical protein ACTXMM_00135 [Psychrobacter maritimus]
MMRNTRLVLALLATFAATAQANANEELYKIKTIKLMYNDAIRAAEKDFGNSSLDTVFAYSDRELQNAIALIQSNTMSRYEEYEYAISPCSDTVYIPKLAVGNAYSINEASAINYRLLNNGRVRASIMVQGNEDINAADFIEYKDFELTCQGATCKVSDVFDSYGNSAKFEADKACR